MNARTQLSASGDVAIPQDVRDRLAWAPGTDLELVETDGAITLRSVRSGSPFPPATLDYFRSLPPYEGPPQPIEAISRLSDEDLRRLIP